MLCILCGLTEVAPAAGATTQSEDLAADVTRANELEGLALAELAKATPDNDVTARLARELVAIRTQLSGENHATTLRARFILTMAEPNDLPKRESSLRVILASQEQFTGKDHPDTVRTLNRLALIIDSQGRPAEAEALFRNELTRRARMPAPDHAATALTLSWLAGSLKAQKRAAEAEPFLLQAVEEYSRAVGPAGAETLNAIVALAEYYRENGRNADAEAILKKRTADCEAHHCKSTMLDAELADLYAETDRLSEAEPLYRRHYDQLIRSSGERHPMSMISGSKLVKIYMVQGRFADALPIARQVLEASETALGHDYVDTLDALLNLALIYSSLGQPAEAEALFRRLIVASEAEEKKHGSVPFAARFSALVVAGKLGMGTALNAQNRPDEAEKIMREALAKSETAFVKDDSLALAAASNLGQVLLGRNKFNEAIPLLERTLVAIDRADGISRIDRMYTQFNLGLAKYSIDDLEGAEQLFEQILRDGEPILGPAHPLLQAAMAGLVRTRLEQPERASLAIEPAAKLADAVRTRARAGSREQDAKAQRDADQYTDSLKLGLLADAAWIAAKEDLARLPEMRRQAFAATQEAQSGGADFAVLEQVLRNKIAATNPVLAERLRQRQSLADQWRQLDIRLAAVFSQSAGISGNVSAIAIHNQLKDVQSKLRVLNTALEKEEPDYVALTTPAALSIEEVRKQLKHDEATLLVMPSPNGTHVFVVTPEDVHWHQSGWSATRMTEAVVRLRYDLGATIDLSDAELQEIMKNRPSGEVGSGFARGEAFALFAEIVAPALPLLKGKRTLFIAAGGPLAGLPFSVLVSRPPVGDDADPASLRSTQWLADDFALVHVPSLQSFTLLRRTAPPSAAASGFLGIGDPILSGGASARDRGLKRSAEKAEGVFSKATRNGAKYLANVKQLRAMSELPGTAVELESVRKTLQAGEDTILSRARATEPNVRGARFANKRVILFSTHGLTAGEAGEAGLVLTPPPFPSDEDDGYLAASEIASLNIDADWVILSACNTATGDGGTSAGLGQLARSFFYAGARNLLASHWPVDDQVAPKMITRTLQLEKDGFNRAEAFARTIAEVRNDRSKDDGGIEASWAHPFFWAPFVLVGDSGTLTSTRP